MLPFIAIPPVLYGPGCHIQSYTPAGVFKGGGTNYLHRTVVDPTGPTQMTASFWVRPIGSDNCVVLGAGFNTSNYCQLGIVSEGFLFKENDGGVNITTLAETAKRRSQGFYHCHFVWDSTHVTSTERLRLTINGVRAAITSGTYPGLNDPTRWVLQDTVQYVGYDQSVAAGRSNFEVADFVILDGTIAEATSFGEFNIHGVWVPIEPDFTVGEYGGEGCWLDFADSSDLGKDVSGKGNHYTGSGVSSANHSDYGPTDVRATLSVIDKGASETLSNGSLTATGGASHDAVKFTLPILPGSDPIYIEATVGGITEIFISAAIGIMRSGAEQSGGSFSVGSVQLYASSSAAVIINTAEFATGGVFNPGDILQLAVDWPNVWVGLNNTWYNSTGGTTGNPSTGANPTYVIADTHTWTPFVETFSNSVVVNVGDTTFAYTPPTGFGQLSTGIYPEPTVKDHSEMFVQTIALGNVIEGNLATLTSGWSGYIEILKRTDASENWRWRWSDDATQSMTTCDNAAKIAKAALESGSPYTGLRIRTGVDYGILTGEVAHTNGVATTVTHSLNAARNCVLVKRSVGGTGDWWFHHPDLTAGKLMRLNDQTVETTDSTITTIGANSFQIGSGAPSGTYRYVVFTENSDCVAMGYYTGNGAADGPMGNCRILPDWSMVTSTNGAHKVIRTSVFTGYNPAHEYSYLNDVQTYNDAGPGSLPVDYVPGGIKVRSTNAQHNTNAMRHIFLAFGRPIGGVCVAPANGR